MDKSLCNRMIQHEGIISYVTTYIYPRNFDIKQIDNREKITNLTVIFLRWYFGPYYLFFYQSLVFNFPARGITVSLQTKPLIYFIQISAPGFPMCVWKAKNSGHFISWTMPNQKQTDWRTCVPLSEIGQFHEKESVLQMNKWIDIVYYWLLQ